jgi:hypothetical protein
MEVSCTCRRLQLAARGCQEVKAADRHHWHVPRQQHSQRELLSDSKHTCSAQPNTSSVQVTSAMLCPMVDVLAPLRSCSRRSHDHQRAGKMAAFGKLICPAHLLFGSSSTWFRRSQTSAAMSATPATTGVGCAHITAVDMHSCVRGRPAQAARRSAS